MGGPAEPFRIDPTGPFLTMPGVVTTDAHRPEATRRRVADAAEATPPTGVVTTSAEPDVPTLQEPHRPPTS